MINEKEQLINDYEIWLAERKRVLPLDSKQRQQVEIIIKQYVLEIFKKSKEFVKNRDESGGWFKYRPFLEHPLISKYFMVLVANGDRNMGKSYSSKEEVRRVLDSGSKFMWIRNIDDEVSGQLRSDIEEGGWLTNLGLDYEGSSKMPNIIDKTGSTVGYYRALNTSSKLKSIDYPNTDLMVVEEFNEGNVSNKFFKLVKLLSTVFRNNPNGKLLLQSNYSTQHDDILQGLGMNAKALQAEDVLIFNWEIGSIIINIPRGVYHTAINDDKDIAYRASLGEFEVWKSQFGGGFRDEEPINLINEKDFTSVTPAFNIYHENVTARGEKSRLYGAYKMTLYHVYDSEGKKHSVLTRQNTPNNKPILIFDYLNKVRYPQAILLEASNLEHLINKWSKGQLKTTNLENHFLITSLFASALKVLARDEDILIEDIESVVS